MTVSDKTDSNSIKQSQGNCGIREFVQYDENMTITCNYKEQRGLLRIRTFNIYDMYEKEIGSIEEIIICTQVQYFFRDENKQLKFYIESSVNCCDVNFTFYGEDKNIEGVIRENRKCCESSFEEYDKYNSKTNTAIKKQECCKNFVYHENDAYGNLFFINKVFCECDMGKLKIYDYNENEISLRDKTVFNGGFTKIQIIIILSLLFPKGNNSDNPQSNL